MVDRTRDAIAAVAARHPDVSLLVLFGSRARNDATERSDWDLGYVATPALDRDGLRVALTTALGTDHVDLVDLDRAGGLVRYRAARDGVPLFERTGDEFARFWFSAVSFWCDMGPIIQAGYADAFRRLADAGHVDAVLAERSVALPDFATSSHTRTNAST